MQQISPKPKQTQSQFTINKHKNKNRVKIEKTLSNRRFSKNFMQSALNSDKKSPSTLAKITSVSAAALNFGNIEAQIFKLEIGSLKLKNIAQTLEIFQNKERSGPLK